jgi:KaiC/GvpD/RAD55 family RecA-like ATPase
VSNDLGAELDHIFGHSYTDDSTPLPNEPPDDDSYYWVPPGPPAGATDDMIEPRPFEIVDLTHLLEHGAAEPDWVPGHVPWLYAGRLTAIQSEPGVGKTWIAIWLALNCINAGGTVLYLDEEGGPELIAERLRLLGATTAQIQRGLLYLPFPTRQWDLGDQAALKELFEERPDIQLAVFDSLPDFLALAGKSEDSAQDVTWWIDRVCGICRNYNVAQVVLDHLVKPDADAKRRSQSRYSRGSGAKLAKVDATLLVETAQDFDAHTSGGLKLWKTKDRRGRLALPNLTSSPVLIDVTVGDGGVQMALRDPEPNVPAAQRHHRPTRLMEKLSEALERLNAAGIKPSLNKLEEAVKGNRAAKIEALRCLIDEGNVVIEAGARNSVLHVLVNPYKELTDPRSDSFMVTRDENEVA